MLGGTTYEETRAVAMLNDQLAASGTRIIIGGSCVHNSTSFIDMIESAAEHYPQTIYNPPPAMAPPTSTYTAPPPPPSSNAPAINLRAGGYELNVGGAAGSGLYRASGSGEIGASFQIPEGLRDGAGRLWGNVRQRVEERVSRAATPQS
jgi:vacuolar protein sorting-associated protein 45